MDRENVILEVRRRREAGEKVAALAKKFGIANSTVSRMARGAIVAKIDIPMDSDTPPIRNKVERVEIPPQNGMQAFWKKVVELDKGLPQKVRRARIRKRYETDPEFKAKILEKSKRAHDAEKKRYQEDPVFAEEQRRKWRERRARNAAQNPELYREHSRKWRAKETSKKKVQAYTKRKWKELTPEQREKIRARLRAWRAKNRDRINAAQREQRRMKRLIAE